MRLLLAEDELEMSNALVAILKHNNYSVDAVYDGAKAENKEVWMPYIYQNESPKTNGKWVRYNSNGGMIKGWYTTGTKKYYYDPTTGAMVKGPTTINGKKYWFGLESGILLHEYSS